MHHESRRLPDDDRLKIAVFVDFDNIEIGVKTTLNRHFDIGAVLEAIKERGEVVTKIAYGNWKQAESYSREMTEYAVHMVQRNTTPGGDKNGADINLALDALEMAFTRDHINAFVIVGGDSDFIALVEKLKQYDKKVFIVGGRAFTSVILQKNCHEFIAYENLVGVQAGTRRVSGRGAATGAARIERAMPLVRRALKVLADREVSPQLGLLKSTLLQLDSTFSERNYGAGTFREFIQKLAHAGYVNLKQVDRSLLVELKESDAAAGGTSAPKSEEPSQGASPLEIPARPPLQSRVGVHAARGDLRIQNSEFRIIPTDARSTRLPSSNKRDRSAPKRQQNSRNDPHNGTKSDPAGASYSREDAADALRRMRAVFQSAGSEARWPMYLRNVRQFLNSADAYFDEHHFSLSRIHDLVREGQRAGLLRIERSRQGGLRVFPGERVVEAVPGNTVAASSAAENAAAPPQPVPESPAVSEPPSRRRRPKASATSSKRRAAAKAVRRPAAES